MSDQYPSGAVPVPGIHSPDGVDGIDSVASIATWWAARRDEPAPEPATRPQTAAARNGAPR